MGTRENRRKDKLSFAAHRREGGRRATSRILDSSGKAQRVESEHRGQNCGHLRIPRQIETPSAKPKAWRPPRHPDLSTNHPAKVLPKTPATSANAKDAPASAALLPH